MAPLDYVEATRRTPALALADGRDRAGHSTGRCVVTDRLVTAAGLAERLTLSTSTILDWFETGRLPGFELGRVLRFRESEVLDWLEAQGVGPVPPMVSAGSER